MATNGDGFSQVGTYALLVKRILSTCAILVHIQFARYASEAQSM